jgi:hypothetical protein
MCSFYLFIFLFIILSTISDLYLTRLYKDLQNLLFSLHINQFYLTILYHHADRLCLCMQLILYTWHVLSWSAFSHFNTMGLTVSAFFLHQSLLLGFAVLVVSASTTYSSGTLALFVLYPLLTYITFLRRQGKMDGVHLEVLSFVLQVWIYCLCIKLEPSSTKFWECRYSLSGAEAMFADLGHFSKISIRVSCLNFS